VYFTAWPFSKLHVLHWPVARASSNIEGMNAEFIRMSLPQGERLKRLNGIAIRQMTTLTDSNRKTLPGEEK
jgi:hypothetical protein